MPDETRKRKRPYRPPAIRSEKILVANLFASTGQECEPNCDFRAPDGES
ncbi:hypothetical protein KYC5002_08505 [Archangium violaceum]|nr:hypothetical protein [Archangium sp. Cb G35]WPB79187.1 hypothetical protein KYC5002_08505 [Archangium gephyra]